MQSNELKKYISQKTACKAMSRKDRNGNPIEFKLTFDEWWDIWQQSGKWSDRGRNKGKYQMCRNNDIGHYEVGNVTIQTRESNDIDMDKSNCINHAGSQGISIMTPQGEFTSMISAARSLGVSKSKLLTLFRKFPSQYYRI
jgi:hypothetical protein